MRPLLQTKKEKNYLSRRRQFSRNFHGDASESDFQWFPEIFSEAVQLDNFPKIAEFLSLILHERFEGICNETKKQQKAGSSAMKMRGSSIILKAVNHVLWFNSRKSRGFSERCRNQLDR